MTRLLTALLFACLCGCAQQTVSFSVKPVEVSSDAQPAAIDVGVTNIVVTGSTNIEIGVTMTNRSVHVSGSSTAMAFIPTINVSVAPSQTMTPSGVATTSTATVVCPPPKWFHEFVETMHDMRTLVESLLFLHAKWPRGEEIVKKMKAAEEKLTTTASGEEQLNAIKEMRDGLKEVGDQVANIATTGAGCWVTFAIVCTAMALTIMVIILIGVARKLRSIAREISDLRDDIKKPPQQKLPSE
jgi:hypothetical protein